MRSGAVVPNNELIVVVEMQVVEHLAVVLLSKPSGPSQLSSNALPGGPSLLKERLAWGQSVAAGKAVGTAFVGCLDLTLGSWRWWAGSLGG